MIESEYEKHPIASKMLIQEVVMKAFIRIPAISIVSAFAWINGATLLSSPALANAVVSVPTALDQQVTVIHHNLMPDTLCASGVTANQVAGIMDAAFESVNEHWDALQAARSTRDTLFAESAELKRLIASGQATEEHITRFDELETLIASAESAFNAVSTSIDLDIFSSMTSAQQQSFLLIRANAKRGVPMEYRVLSLDEDEWVKLRDAIAAVRTFDEDLDLDQPTAAQQLISSFDGSYEVNLARTYLETRFETVSQQFTSVMNSLN